MYIIWIKDFVKRPNMRKDYKKQILDYNIKKFSLIVGIDLDMFSCIKTLT